MEKLNFSTVLSELHGIVEKRGVEEARQMQRTTFSWRRSDSRHSLSQSQGMKEADRLSPTLVDRNDHAPVEK